MKVSSPTLSRLGKMLTLHCTAFNHAELECAIAKSAFLQGDGQEMQDPQPTYARALDEIKSAMKVPLGSAVGICDGYVGTWERTTKLMALG